MAAAGVFFAKPAGDPTPLRERPRLASWMAADHPDQVRLRAFLDHAESAVQPRLALAEGALALWLDIGLPSHISLLDQHDLDNYLLPLTNRLIKSSGRQFDSVWATKRHAEASSIYVGPAMSLPNPPAADRHFDVRTTVSSETIDYKEQISDQLAEVEALPEGPVTLELSFTVGTRRNWTNLWKPTIDSLDRLLGQTIPGRPWHPRDGRIVELGLHRCVDPSIGDHVNIAGAASRR